MDFTALMDSVRAAFLSNLQGALGGVTDVGTGLVMSAVPLVVGLACIRAAAGASMPVGALVDSFLVLGVSIAALQFWPQVIHLTVDQIHLMGGVAGVDTADPFETVTAGAALATRSFEQADSALSLWDGWGIWVIFLFTGVVLFLLYLGISALSLIAWVEYWGAAVILGPMTAFLPIAGFTNAGFVPFSFLLSATARIVGIALVAGYGSFLIATYAIPGVDEEATYGHALAALAISTALAGIAWCMNSMILGILMGRPGFTVSPGAGVGAMRSAITATASSLSGGGGSGGSSSGRGSGSGSGGSSGSRGPLASTSQPVTGNARP